ncbi:hypothetical protein PTKIN_Ptkin05aG0186100 [Pterospermum kingtungense]
MEKTSEWEQRNIISELRQGRKLVRQLLLHLNLDSSIEILAHRIEVSYEKALSMLRSNTSLALGEKPSELAAKISEAPPPPIGSTPWSEDYDCTLREGMPKKRKTLPRWTNLVQVGTALEGPLEDCYSWRKYGQKDILGSKYPRGYYRCTHRNNQGCLATKQVQRSDDVSTIFEVTYIGRHTCEASNTMASAEPSENQEQGISSVSHNTSGITYASAPPSPSPSEMSQC